MRTEEGRSPTAGDGTDAERVHERLRDAILHGRLAPGSVVSQVALAGEFGVSRTPLREAIRMLQREGLVSAGANRQVRIADSSIGDLDALYAMRIVNEALAVRVTVPATTAGDHRFIEEQLDLMDRCAADGDALTYQGHHFQFHHRLTGAAGERYSRLLAELFDHSERYRRLYLAGEPRAWTVGANEHREIAAAYWARDAERASDLTALHLSNTALSVLTHLAPTHEPVMVRSALRAVLGGSSGAGQWGSEGPERFRSGANGAV